MNKRFLYSFPLTSLALFAFLSNAICASGTPDDHTPCFIESTGGQFRVGYFDAGEKQLILWKGVTIKRPQLPSGKLLARSLIYAVGEKPTIGLVGRPLPLEYYFKYGPLPFPQDAVDPQAELLRQPDGALIIGCRLGYRFYNFNNATVTNDQQARSHYSVVSGALVDEILPVLVPEHRISELQRNGFSIDTRGQTDVQELHPDARSQRISSIVVTRGGEYRQLDQTPPVTPPDNSP